MANKAKKKVAALKAELAALKARVLEEAARKVRDLEEAGAEMAAELLAKESELAEYKAAAEAAGRTPGAMLDEEEERTEAAEGEHYAKRLATEHDENRRKRYTEAAEKHRELAQPETTKRVVNGRVQDVPVTATTWDVPPKKQVAYTDRGHSYNDRGEQIS